MSDFLTSTEFLKRYDWRLIAELASDTGYAIPDETQVLTDVNVLACLNDGAGMIVAYALKGGRYTEAQLIAMTGNGAYFLKRLNADLALYNIVLRRGLPVDQYPQIKEALKLLEKLADGELIFPLPANIEAGVAQSPPLTVQTIAVNNFLTNSVRYFPTQRYTNEQL